MDLRVNLLAITVLVLQLCKPVEAQKETPQENQTSFQDLSLLFNDSNVSSEDAESQARLVQNAAAMDELDNTVTLDPHMFLSDDVQMKKESSFASAARMNETEDLDSDFIIIENPDEDITDKQLRIAEESVCGKGWYLYNETQTCFRILLDESDWLGALLKCGDTGGATLAIISSEFELDWLQSVPEIQGNLWTGSSDVDEEGSWTTTEDDKYDGPWIENEAETETNESLTSEDEGEDSKDCQVMVMSTANVTISTRQCSRATQGALCERPTMDQPSLCPPMWYLYKGRCYKIEVASGTWSDAKFHCAQREASLAAPRTQSEYEFLLRMGAGEGCWLGAADISQEGNWLTLDNAAYTGPWGKTEPNSLNGDEDCLSIQDVNDSLVIGDRICEDTGTCAICSRLPDNTIAVVVTTTPKPTTTTATTPKVTPEPPKPVETTEEPNITTTTTIEPNDPHCPKGWFFFDFICIRFERVWCNFYTAERMCNSKGGTLMSIDSTEEADFVVQTSSVNYWVGASRRGHIGMHVNADGTTYTGPPPMSLHSSGDKSDCIFVSRDERTRKKSFVSQECKNMLEGFVCEQPAKMMEGDVECGSFWTYHKNHCFYINTNVFNYQEAKESCEYIQSRLAYPNDTDDVEFFHQIGASHEYWIGANDIEQEGLWMTEADRVYEGPWADGYPKADTNENCMQLREIRSQLNVAHTNCWSNGTGAICRKDAPVARERCPDGFFMYEGRCFILLDHVGSREDASFSCRSVGTRLAVPYHLGFFEFFQNMGAAAGVWLGPSDMAFESIWVTPQGSRYNPNEIWGEGEPGVNHDLNCMMITEKGGCIEASAQDCDYVGTGAVCEMDPSEGLVESSEVAPVIESDAAQDPYCPESWKNFHGSCYKVLHNRGDFYSGILACQEQGGILAVIHGTEEKDFVVSLGAGDLFWVGSTDEGHEGVWLNSDGGFFTVPWGPDQPDNGGIDVPYPENCMALMDFGIGLYLADTDCLSAGNGSVCERNILEFQENETETNTVSPFDIMGDIEVSSCPSEQWSSEGENCYLLMETSMSYYQAQSACSDSGGSLATLSDAEQLQYVQNLDVTGTLWVGLVHDSDSGNIVTIDGTNFTLYEELGANMTSDIILEDEDEVLCYLLNKQEGGSVSIQVDNCRLMVPGAICRRKKYSDSEGCPKAWFYNEELGRCYFREQGRMSWDEAQSRCASYNADLLTPSSQSEVAFVVSMGASKGDWFGSKDDSVEGSFVDKFGTPYRGTWAKGQPKNINNEDCMNLYLLNGVLGVNDYPCKGMPDSNGAICVMEEIPSKEAKDALPTCDNGWVLAEGECYKVLKGLWNYDKAATECANVRSVLAYPRNHAENYYILKMASDNFWLGASDVNEEGIWKSADGLPFTGVWGAEGAVNIVGNEDCMIIQNGTAASVSCDFVGRGAICRRRANLKSKFCPKNWLENKMTGKCYALVSRHLSWDDAKEECQSLDAVIASVPDAETSAFLVTMGGVSGVWLGAEDRSSEGSFVDANGTAIEQPYSGSVALENSADVGCLRMEWDQKMMVPRMADCEDKNSSKGAICERVKGGKSAVEWCPDGWAFYYGRCYRLFKRPVTWAQARDGCQTFRGRLAYPDNEEDVSFFLSLGSCDNMYLGATDIGSEGQFVTLTGKPYTKEKPWLPGQPNNNEEKSGSFGRKGLGEDCLALRGVQSKLSNSSLLYGVDDVDCHEKLQCFMCSRESGTLHDYNLCPPGWSYYDGSCHVVLRGQWDWLQSRAKCGEVGAEMAYPNDGDHLQFMIDEGLQPGFFLGATDIEFEGAWATVDGTSYEGPWGLGKPEMSRDANCMILEAFGVGLLSADDCSCSAVGKGTMCKREVLKEPDCPDGWSPYKESCYKISGGNWTWLDAKEYCEDFGAMMAFPSDQDLLDYFLTLGASEFFWFGSTDKDNEGTWVNFDGTNYEGPWGNQLFRRPSDENGTQDCMNLMDSSDGLFVNDDECSIRGMGTICVRRMDQHPKCPVGWYLYGGKCYGRQLGFFNYSEAESVCHSYNSKLASLWDIGQLDFALSFGAGFGTWLGSDDYFREGEFLTDRGYKYPGPWRHGQPDGEETENCMIIWQFDTCLGVADTRCSFPGTGALCEFIPPHSLVELPPTTLLPPLMTTTAENPCQEGWSYSGTSCYKILDKTEEGTAVNASGLNFFQAIELCGQFGSHPATIQTSSELNFIASEFNESLSMGDIWLGTSTFSKNSSHVFINLDLSQIELSTEILESLILGEDVDSCLTLSSSAESNSSLSSWSCWDKQLRVVCEKLPGTAVLCSQGYSLFNGYCFKKSNDMQSWSEASTACETSGGSLATIASPSQKAFLTYLAGSDALVWIGVSYSQKRSDWINSDESDFVASLMESVSAGNCLSVRDGELVPDDCRTRSQYICQTIAGAGEDSRCLSGWLASNGSCYKTFSSEKLSWFESINFCFEYDAYPAIIGSGQELAAVYTFSSGNLWIGSNDLRQEGVFKNIDDSPVSDWFSSSAKNEDADCLKIIEIDGSLVVNQAPCKEKSGVLCEKTILDRAVLGCPYSYVRYHDACYKKEFGLKDWYEAKDMCEQVNAQMAVPNTEDQLMFLSAFGNGEDLWLASSDQSHEGIWINSDRSQYVGRWLPSQPDNFDDQNCMSLGSQQLDYGPVDKQCNKAGVGVICRQSIHKEEDECPFGWRKLSNSCYYNGESLFNGSWFDAAVRCHYHGGYLASINSVHEKVIIAEDISYPTWLGTYSFIGNELRNVDNTIYRYPVQVDYSDASHMQHCLMSSRSVDKNEVRVNSIVTGCEQNATYQCEAPTRGSQITSKCPDGYMHFYNRCYKFVRESTKWDEAQSYCLEEGGYLAVPNTQAELLLLKSLAQKYPYVYLGVSDDGHENFWVGADSTEYALGFGAGQPDNCCSGEHCMAFAYDQENRYSINDISCSLLASGFICEQLDSDAQLDPLCPKGWEVYDNSTCVLVRLLDDVSWRDAMFGCSFFSASLAKLRDQKMLDFLYGLGAEELLWVGAHDHGNESFWKNMDGSDYKGPWAENQPDNHIEEMLSSLTRKRRSTFEGLPVINNPDAGSITRISGEQCAIVNQQQVYDFPCEFKAKGYVCEKPRVGLSPCAWNMIFFEGHCYQTHFVSETWSDSVTRCTEQKGYLATINSLTELLFVKDLVDFTEEVWLGATDKAEEGSWVNMDGSLFNRDLFLKGEPDDHAGTEDCLVLTRKNIGVGSEGGPEMQKYGLADVHCDTIALASVCEFPRNDDEQMTLSND